MPNEEQLFAVNGEELVLTNQRIQMADMDRGNIELPLEQVHSVTIQRRGYRLLFIPGCISLLIGASLFGTSYSNQFQVALIAGIILLMFWWVTRKRTISVATNDTVSNVDVDEMTSEEIADLINDIQAARTKRLSEIKQNTKKGVKANA
jgi:hypothetical protein